MKVFKILALVLAFGSFLASAQAGIGSDSSWGEIKKARNYSIGFPTIFFSHGIGVTVDELCVDGDALRPFNPERTVCVEWETVSEGRDRCVRYEEVVLSTPCIYTAERCVKWEVRNNGERCLVSETYTAAHPLSYNVSVYKIDPRGEYRDAFKKQFEIPACN